MEIFLEIFASLPCCLEEGCTPGWGTFSCKPSAAQPFARAPRVCVVNPH